MRKTMALCWMRQLRKNKAGIAAVTVHGAADDDADDEKYVVRAVNDARMTEERTLH